MAMVEIYLPLICSRHELQHFINVMEGYLMNQIFYLSWREFEVEMSQTVSCVSCVAKQTNVLSVDYGTLNPEPLVSRAENWEDPQRE